MKKLKYLLPVFILGMISCQEDNANIQTPVSAQPQTFEELKVSDQFNWSTQKEYTLSLEGIKGLPYEIVNRLRVLDQNGKMVFQRNVKMGQTQVLNFSAAGANTSFTVEYGDLSKEVVPTGNELTFNFLPAVDNSDLDADNI